MDGHEDKEQRDETSTSFIGALPDETTLIHIQEAALTRFNADALAAA